MECIIEEVVCRSIKYKGKSTKVEFIEVANMVF